MPFRSVLSAGLLAALLAACGSEGQEREEALPGEALGSSDTMAPAPTEEPSCFLAGATIEEARGRVSPHTRLTFSYEGGQGLLCYAAPSARGRTIMGALVPYGELWRMGADEATSIHLTAPASIGGVELPPGSYSLYAVPTEGEWEFFVNTNWQRSGIPVDATVRESEIASFAVVPEPRNSVVESLTYRFEDGAIVMEWENTRLRIPVGGA
jgi:hypothetical protein